MILLFFFFWVYEAFDLWASPWLTAWVATAYFATAFVFDGFFKGAAFCKHVCPIGQFNFFGSLISPTQVAVRDPSLCSQCKTKDCIHGRFDERGRLRQQGCELGLFQPRKVGNLDCTFCLDCIQACPYQNVTILVRPPLHAERDLETNRSGIGRLPARTDWLALVILFVALSLLNAFGMVSPVYRLLGWLSHTLRVVQEPLLILLLFGTGIVTFLLALALASLLSSGLPRQYSARWFFRRLTFTLIPLGFAMWSAHYLFHFLTGALTVTRFSNSSASTGLAYRYSVSQIGHSLESSLSQKLDWSYELCSSLAYSSPWHGSSTSAAAIVFQVPRFSHG